MDRLKALRADLLTPEEKEELKRLEARYPDVPLDRTRIEDHVLMAAEAMRRLLRAREADPGLRDQEQRGP
jgi:hypothetical protein